jgi:GT2 family glycosyltransferase
MEDTHPAVAAIVLSRNNFQDTDECLRSLVAQAYPNLRAIIVDNGSDDDSLERLSKAWHTQADIIRLPDNLGVPGGYNAGIRAALEGNAEYILLLNNDVILRPGLIDALLPAFDAVPRLGTVTPIITYHHDPNLIWFAGAVYSSPWGVTRHRFLSKPLPAADDFIGRLYPTDYIPTCVAMSPRHVFEDVGLLDDRFFIGHDDVDWSLRLRDRGYELRVAGRPLAAHKISATAGRRGSNVLGGRQAYHYAKNSMLIAAKHSRGWRLWPYLAGQALVRLPYYSAQMALDGSPGGIPAYLRGLRDGYRAYLRKPDLKLASFHRSP